MRNQTTQPIIATASGHPAWHALSVQQALTELDADADGLSSAQAHSRLAQYGPNRLPEAKRRSPLLRFFSHFHNLLIYVLLGAAAITAALAHWVDTGVILAVVMVNAVIGFVQEGKAEDALAAIRQMLSPQAMVLRDRRRLAMSAEQLVPGDVVLLQAGDKVPADVRLLRVKSLQIQEAVLTGESVAVEKTTGPTAADTALADRRCMAYSGTLVSYGHAVGVVVATGAATQIGHISALVSQVQTLTTPLLAKMSVFARWLTLAVLVLAALVFLFGVTLRDFSAVEMFMTVVGLAVAAIPEGLPAILSVTLAIGVQRMATRRAIIRRLPAVETLGSVSIICTDKTGTLTRNEMTVRSIVCSGKLFEVSGTGYDPHGDFSREGTSVNTDEHAVLLQTLRAVALCNDTSLEHKNAQWQVHGDPMEGALLVAALKAGLELETETKRHPRTDLIPFDSQHKFMATLHHGHEGEAFVYLKGAPERVLQMCHRQRLNSGDAPLDSAFWHQQIDTLASRGQRVLAVACKSIDPALQHLDFEHVDNGLVLLGLFGLIDPPREEAISAVAQCQQAGIRVKMITGDHAVTARAIAAQLNLANTTEAITGHDIDQMDEQTLRHKVKHVDVYARVSPEHKLRLVSLLQEQGAIVAMTGDGVNDAPALKRADVGIAMGHKGTEAAKEASEMVITDDNFASIAHAVEEGRTVYNNLKKAIVFLLPVNGGESLSIISAIMLGFTLPITPLQILWVNMVSSVALAMALAFEPAEPDIMQRPPRPAREALLSGFLLWRIALVSVLFAAGVFGIFTWSQYHGSTLEESRTYAVSVLVVMEVFYLFSVRYLHAASMTLKGVLGTRAVLIAVTAVVVLQLIFTYAPFMERLFDTRPVNFIHGVEILSLGVLLFAILELEKWLRRRWRAARSNDINDKHQKTPAL